MSRRNKIIYWVSTVWLALGMVSTGIVQILGIPEETRFIIQLGYPSYLLPFLGATKLAGVVAIFLPRTPILKEWAYAGFTFTMVGALYSHIVSSSGIGEVFPPILLLVLISVSWYFRPAEKKASSLQ